MGKFLEYLPNKKTPFFELHPLRKKENYENTSKKKFFSTFPNEKQFVKTHFTFKKVQNNSINTPLIQFQEPFSQLLCNQNFS